VEIPIFITKQYFHPKWLSHRCQFVKHLLGIFIPADFREDEFTAPTSPKELYEQTWKLYESGLEKMEEMMVVLLLVVSPTKSTEKMFVLLLIIDVHSGPLTM